MHVALSHQPVLSLRTDLLVLGTTAKTWSTDLAPFDRALSGHLRKAAGRVAFTAADGGTLLFQTHGALPAHALVIVGVDPTKSPQTWYQLADLAVQRGRELKAERVAVVLCGDADTSDTVACVAEGLGLSAYRFERFKSQPSARDVTTIEIITGQRTASVREALARGRVLAEATCYARDLITTPAAEMTPNRLAQEARRLARSHHLGVRIFDEAALRRHGMGAILGVAQGSAQPPRLIELRYRPHGRPRKRIAIVGKGITFDSGGLSLKPNDSMKLMKTDMAGGAAVIATMSALARLGAPVRVTGLVAAAENMPSGTALRVGDVIRHYGGRTVEVLNTDAEGRLVLADALAYADAVLAPDVVVDLATLTGAARVALGSVMAALYATDDGLAAALLDAGTASGDRLWRMPLAEEYRAGLDSPVADLANVAGGPGRAGSIDAALFLREFTGGRAWAHLDIAGAARATADDGETTKGATGFGTRLLLHWLAAGAPAATA
ncbi:MAG TPA: leucyl aminopeptidase [Candidatus Binatia bacterium]|nr:leucyl aminopeptidase [Candidatus Binatia bacterium]